MAEIIQVTLICDEHSFDPSKGQKKPAACKGDVEKRSIGWDGKNYRRDWCEARYAEFKTFADEYVKRMNEFIPEGLEPIPAKAYTGTERIAVIMAALDHYRTAQPKGWKEPNIKSPRAADAHIEYWESLSQSQQSEWLARAEEQKAA